MNNTKNFLHFVAPWLITNLKENFPDDPFINNIPEPRKQYLNISKLKALWA